MRARMNSATTVGGFRLLPNAVVHGEASGAWPTELRGLPPSPMAGQSCSSACKLLHPPTSLAFAGCVGMYNTRGRLFLRAWELPRRHRLQYRPFEMSGDAACEVAVVRPALGKGGQLPKYSPPYTSGFQRLSSPPLIGVARHLAPKIRLRRGRLSYPLGNPPIRRRVLT